MRDYPDPSVPRSEILLRLAVANARVGDAEGAQRVLGELKDPSQPPPSARMLRVVTNHVQECIGQMPPASESSKEWHAAFGCPARDGHMPSLPAAATSATLSELWVQDFSRTLSGAPPVHVQQPVFFGGGGFMGQNARMIEQKLGIGVINGPVQMAVPMQIHRRWNGPVQVQGLQFPAPQGGFVQFGGIVIDVNSRTQGQPASAQSLGQRWQDGGWFPSGQILLSAGRMYYKSDQRLVCCDAATGKVLWMGRRNGFQPGALSQQFARAGGGGGSPMSPSEVRFFGDRVHQATSILGDCVYCVEGPLLEGEASASGNARHSHHSHGNVPGRTRINWLSAYDAATGKFKWRRSTNEENPSDSGNGGFLAAPAAFGDLLLVPVIDGGTLWLLALDSLDNGKTVWKTYLCDEPEGGCSPWSPVAVAVEGSDAYVATGAGAVLAVDAASGAVRWAVRYQRSGQASGSGGTIAAIRLEGWSEDVVIPRGKQLIVMPSDYNQLFALDRRTGEFLWDSPMTPSADDSPARYCLGVLDDGLYVAGNDVVRRYSVVGGSMVWQKTVEGSVGRGVLTGDAVYLPVRDSVMRIAVEDGRDTSQVGVFSPRRVPVGNLFSDGERLIVVGAGRVYTLTGLKQRLATLKARIEQGDVPAHVQRMQLLFRMGKTDDAIDDLQGAYHIVLAGDESAASAELRQMLYNGILHLGLQKTHPLVALELLATERSYDDALRASLDEIAQKQLVSIRSGILSKALETIRTERPEGAARAVLTAAPLCEMQHLRFAARRALAATAGASDKPALLTAVGSDDPLTRELALAGVSRAFGKEANKVLLPVLSDPDSSVSLAAALALANRGSHQALPVLGKLLESADLEIRVQSCHALCALTGKRFRYVAYEPADKRAAAAKAWQQWIAKEGRAAKLKYPIADRGTIFGKTLLCLYGANKVVELDAQGKETWAVTVPQPWDAQGLPNGHRLIASYTGRMVVEYDASGKEVWRKENIPGNAASVQRLDNGNTLVACAGGERVVEYRPDGEIAWQHAINGRPVHARRLDNGNTLIALQSSHRVVEVDQQGKVVWQLQNMSGAFAAERLPNGNTLIAMTGSGNVTEVDRSAHVVWAKGGLNNPYDVQRLQNGNTLIIDTQGLREVTPSGEETWIRKEGNMLRVCRY